MDKSQQMEIKEVCGYMSSDMKQVTRADGTIVSQRVIVTSSWRTPRSYISSRYYQVRVPINGVWYTGRTAGGSMFVRLKISARQSA